MKTLNERLAWLAGIIDGEGTVSLQISSRKRRAKPGFRRDRGRIRERTLVWKIDVSNTNASLISEVVSILDSLGVRYFFGKYNMKNPKHKPLTKVIMTGRPRVVKLIQFVKPWLVCKLPQAEILLRAADRRGLLGYQAKALDDPVLGADIIEIRRLNQRGMQPASDELPREFGSTLRNSRDVVGAQRQVEKIPTEATRNRLVGM